ncbi:MAG TPA: L-threonylcarbamoyladenylate synthase [Wenzhouxiangella sp.]|nr:L-threonylcarbamoyladenylate synthase [Wenzhouxiangella sp.]
MITLGTGQNDLEQAAAMLAAGRLVAVPTETVYGLAADASSPEAIRRIFAAKERPADHPLIVHLPDVQSLALWARRIPPAALQLAEAFWPGPLTLVLHKARHVPKEITGGQETVAVRLPGHPVALALLKQFGGAVAAPSANRFGRISPTTAQHVVDEFGDSEEVAAVIDGGPCPVGVESTIVDLTGNKALILRPGSISAGQLETVLGYRPARAAQQEGPRASGRLKSHYAPATPLFLADDEDLKSPDGETAVLALGDTADPGGFLCWLSLPARPEAYARGLYAALRVLDGSGARRILAQKPPASPAWAAVNDRLARASS